MRFSAKKDIVIAAHRGNPCMVAENTMESFRSAIELGADMIETDIHLTQDGELVLMHDDDVKRMTGVSGLVRHMTLEEIQQLTVGDPTLAMHVPTLKEFLELCAPVKDLLLDLEIKVYAHTEGIERMKETVDKTIALCDTFDLQNRILFNSFDAAVLEYIHKKYGKRFLLHGYYPYHDIMRNITIDPAEYLDYACYWGTGETAKKCCEALLSQGIAPCTGSRTAEKDFFEHASFGCAMFTENDPASALRWREQLK